MKKSFTLFSVSALFLMLLFPVSVKADETLTFKWTQAPNNVVSDGDFSYSGDVWNAVRQDWSDTFVGFNSNVTATSRSTYALNSGTFTFTLRILWRNENRNNCNVPKIQLNDGTPFTHSQINLSDGVPVNVEYSVTVPSIGSYTIKVITQDGDNWKFGMESLTIPSAAFATTYSVLATASNGSVVGIGSYAAGATVTLTPNPDPYYAFSSWSELSGITIAGYEDDNPLTFTMPGNAVSVTANFVSSPCTNTLIIQCEDYVSYNTKPSGSNDNKPENLKSKDYTGYGDPIGGYYVDFDNSTGEMWIPVTLPAGTFTFTVRYVKGGDNMWFNLYDVSNNSKIDNSKQLSQKGDSWDSDVSNSYTLTSGDYVIGIYGNDNYTGLDQITITASTNVFCNYTYNITMADGENGGDPTSDVASAAEGATVTVTAGEPESGYYFSGWSASPTVTFSDASVSPATFSMPASDVTITANYAALVSSAFTYTTSGSGSITCATESGSNVVSGTAISMTAVPGGDYVFTGWTASAGSFSDASALTTTFTMPAEAAEVTANFAQVYNVITVGSESGSSANIAGGGASITESNISDFDAFAHNVIKLAYSNMSGNDKWYGWNLGKQGSYNSANSAGATGFGFYYKTESTTDAVALWFDPNHGDKDVNQHGMQLPATNNVWKYVYFAHADANSWNKSYMRIFINGDKDSKSTAHASGAIYIAEIAATSITSKPEINSYTYTRANASNSYGTLCLPMDGSVSGATLYSVAGKQEEGGKLYIVLEEQGITLAAGEPYIFETNGSTLTATMSGQHSAVTEDANGLVGTYQQITAPAYSEPNGLLNYILALDDSHNTVFKRVGENVTIGAYRAYINIHNAVDYSPASAAPGRKYIRFGIEGTEEEQAVEMIYDDASLRTRKIMQNGRLYILRDGHLFTAQGTQIK